MDELITYGTDAHTNNPDENPLDCIGPEITDPWDDPEQSDWATETLDIGEVT